jgi:predicted MPP superfamily phosphohydrolase
VIAPQLVIMQLRPLTSPQGRRLARRVAVGLLALFGAVVGMAVAPAAQAHVGPLTVDVKVRPSLTPGATVDLPPVGSVQFPTHSAPVQIQAGIRSVDVEQARALIDEPAQLRKLTAAAPDIVKRAAARALGISLLFAFAGAALMAGLATRSWRGVGLGASVVAVATLLLGGLTALTFDSAQLAEPRFTGLLSSAPYVQRRTTSLAERLESYRSGLSDFVQSVTTLYAVGQQLPRPDTGVNGDVTTVLHISDLHLNPLGFDLTARLVDQFGVDVVIDSGDLSTWGTAMEEGFVNRIGALKVPYVFVRGNHDSQAIADAVARQRNATVLDGEVTSLVGLRIAGVADPRDLPAEGSKDDLAKDQVAASVQRLAGVVDGYDAEHPQEPVQIAVVHDPTRLSDLVGKVPVILSGHMHARDVSYASGTRTMVEGSTGGAGLTANGLARLTEGDPVPLEASLLYFAKTGADAGRLLAYDEVTVGGLGLTSVSIRRVLVPKDEVNPPPTPSPTPSPVSLTSTSAPS